VAGSVLGLLRRPFGVFGPEPTLRTGALLVADGRAAVIKTEASVRRDSPWFPSRS
jgi:hypothetical protein